MAALAAGCAPQTPSPNQLTPLFPNPTTFDCCRGPSVCEVHHIEMTRKDVPVNYGHPGLGPSAAFRAAEKQEFPNSPRDLEGGCNVRNRDDRAIVWSCARCESARAAYIAAHPNWNSIFVEPDATPILIDLRPRLTALGLTPRPQGARGTCSIFTTCEALEYALQKDEPHPVRFSPEFVNWAAGQAAGRPSDGNFFHNALNGFEKFGICTEAAMPYQPGFDAALTPSDAARAEASKTRDDSHAGPRAVSIHWIVPWQPDRFGVSDEQLAEIKRVLTSGYPVAAGSGHSRLLVGFHDDRTKAGGGTFFTEDSALNRFDEVSYEFVRTKVADVFWVESASSK
jgi:hypothetical protein